MPAEAMRCPVGPFGFAVDLAPGEADSGDIEQDLPRLFAIVAQAAADRNTAIALFVDEVQYLAPEELGAVIVGCHEIAQRNLPFLFVGAGLPQVVALSGRAKSYAERLFDYPSIGPLDPADARAALLKPARGGCRLRARRREAADAGAGPTCSATSTGHVRAAGGDKLVPTSVLPFRSPADPARAATPLQSARRA